MVLNGFTSSEPFLNFMFGGGIGGFAAAEEGEEAWGDEGGVDDGWTWFLCWDLFKCLNIIIIIMSRFEKLANRLILFPTCDCHF